MLSFAIWSIQLFFCILLDLNTTLAGIVFDALWYAQLVSSGPSIYCKETISLLLRAEYHMKQAEIWVPVALGPTPGVDMERDKLWKQHSSF